MNSLIESLNVWGSRFFDFALPMLWQSSLLMAAVLAFDFLLRRKIRPAVRYTLWFAVFVKLLLPPTLALPTGPAWWLRMRPAVVVAPPARTLTIDYREPVAAPVPAPMPFMRVETPRPRLSRDAWVLLGASFVSALLAAWSAFRWWHIARCVRGTTSASGEMQEMLAEARRRAGLRKNVRLQLTAESMSPAVCGLFRPVVLLPQSLIERLTSSQLQAVLLHELIHLRRRDVWVNCAQTLLQIAYWWHPLLWVANARVRRVREEAVDDAVMFALSEEAEIYAPTLLEVAKLAFNRPLASLGLVGILESRNALRHRIERLLNFTTPRRVGVSAVSVLCIAAFTALAVPMGEPPARSSQSGEIPEGSNLITFHAKVNPEIFMRNINARAGETMHTTNDDWNDILVSILDGFGVDCTPPRNITFNAETGELSMQNTSEALTIVDEVVKELNLPGGERILNPPHGLKQVLIEAQFYQMRPEDVAKLQLEPASVHRDGNLSPWWELSVAQITDVRERLKELGVRPISSPRIQTAHSIAATLSVMDGTNNIQLECVPFIRDGFVNLTALARTTGKYAPEGGWPDFAGQTNCAIFSRIGIHNGDGALLRATDAGADSELILMLKAKILEPKAPVSPAVTGGGASVATTTNANRPTAATEQIQVSQLTQEGKLLYQLSKYDEAETKLNQALAIQPDNEAALYYLSLIKQHRIMAAVDKDVPKFSARTNTIHTSAARQKLFEKLNDITFDKISFRNVPLADVVRDLTEQVKRRDPDQQGINFVLNRAKLLVNSTSQPVAFNPTTGASIPATTPEDVDLAAVMISLDPGLTNVRLLDVLEAITKSSDHPIKYSLLDYGIEFSLKGSEAPELHTRTFKLDPNTFYKGLQDVGVLSIPRVNITGGGGGQGSSTSNAASASVAVGGNRGLRYVTGLDNTTEIQLAIIKFFDTIGVKLAAPKSVFFNARQGTLTVHATDEDLELVEQAINTLNIAPPEVTVKVRFVEAEPAFLATLFTNDSVGETSGPWTGILTESRFKRILKTLQKRDNGTLLEEGEVTTLSGRQANFQVVDVKTVVSGLKATVTTNGTDYGYETTNMQFGTTLDIIPGVLPDGYTISMNVTPKVTEFLGYDDPKVFEKYDERLKHAKLPLVKYRVRQMMTSATISDGQTLVLGNLTDESVAEEPNGPQVRQPFIDKKKKQLVVFISPVIIDHSGNRVHSADYYDGPIN